MYIQLSIRRVQAFFLKHRQGGRTDTFLHKFMIGVIIVTIIYVLTYAPYLYNVLNTYGVRGINASICSIEAFSNWTMSIKGYLIFISVVRYAALICAMLIIYFLSSRLKSVISTFLAKARLFWCFRFCCRCWESSSLIMCFLIRF